MKISLLQADLAWRSPDSNRMRLEALIEGAAQADLYLLPEMFTTGFTMPPDASSDRDGTTLAWMKGLSARKGAALAGTVSTVEDGKYYNRFWFVKPDGSAQRYDKRHLFTYSGEDKYYTAGKERVVVDFLGWRILLLVCYDLRFPVWARSKQDYDMILCVASWPEARIGAWDALLRARAIENQCYVAGVNRIGDDPAAHYNGHSALIDPYGNTVAAGEDNTEGVIHGEVDMALLEAFRAKFPVLKDADPFEIL